MAKSFDVQRIYSITRPESGLLILYLIRSLGALIFFPLVFIPLAIRYATLRYRFDEDSIYKSYGLFFKQEDLVQYSRIQDLHVSKGLIERWLGLGTIEVQTAAGSATAEMTIEGMANCEEIRDFLYWQMRGARFGDQDEEQEPHAGSGEPADTVVSLLTEIRDEIRLLGGQHP
ncbi:MAG: hypothetical protein KatS3mg105_4514 [Gemmatales bacterium]|nr:MAG: hypothetical protein KatS3mg105_4514 [Gemmatales bacterium]